jgi:hypothetical protein
MIYLSANDTYAFSGKTLDMLRFLLDNIFDTGGYCDLVQNYAFLVKKRKAQGTGRRAQGI